jgi:uncharacterized protein YqeY
MSTLRLKITEDMKQAMKDKDALTLGTLRLVNAALKDKDIEIRVAGVGEVSDADVFSVLQKMLKQREESSKVYRENGRLELAEQEDAEISVINKYMPKQLSESDLSNAIDAAIKESGAQSGRDMGKVVAIIKDKYAGQVNMGQVSQIIKTKLN